MRTTMLLEQHRLATLIVALALAATAGFFMFGMPKGPDHGDSSPLVFAEAVPPDHGWTWSNGTPGFAFGQHDDMWNVSQLRPVELDGLRRAAPRFGVAPESLRILSAMRTSMSTPPQIIVAGSDAAGNTCIGVQRHHGPSRFLCQKELARTPGVVVLEAVPKYGNLGYAMFVTGLVRADVTRVTVTSPGSTYLDARGPGTPVVKPLGPAPAYARATPGWWGTLQQSTSQPGPWHATVAFYGAHGRLATADVRFTHPGERVVLVG